MDGSTLENVTRKVAIALGIAMLIASIYLSYDGFDQQVTGGNTNYSLLAAAIGVTLAVAFSLCEFIVTSRADNLNSTLKWIGLAAYAYSIGTNYLGLEHLLGMSQVMSGITAVAMDILPEQMIAWGLGEAVMHDLFGNLGKFAAAPIGKGGKGGKGGGGGGGGGGDGRQQPAPQPHFQSSRQNQQSARHDPHSGKGNGHERRAQLEAQYRAQKEVFDELGDTGKMKSIRQ